MAPSLSPLFRVTLPLLFLAASLGLTRAQEIPSDRDQIVHVLNRITFGPRPGDVEMVQKMGLRNFIEQQLHPETIDDSATDQIIAQFDILQLNQQQLTDIYVDDLKKILKKAQKNANQQLAAGQAAPALDATTQPKTPVAEPPTPATQPPPMDQEKPAMTDPQAQQLQAQVPGLPPGLAQKLAEASQYRSVAAVGELEQAKLVRAVDSQRQLQEVLVDFWNNHFNVDVKKKMCSVLKVSDDRDVIRPHIWGRFRDLLEADAKSPAMLVYLDNASSTVAHTVTPMEQQVMQTAQTAMAQTGLAAVAPEVPAVGQKRGGINENYGRELMELHTIGVDGGYTQQDVTEVARCFTGWSVDRKTGAFAFHARQHDDGAKVVLGHNIPAGGGMQDGETVLDILASSPACAHFISRELCQRFVADDPSPALVDRIATVFTNSGGDLRAVTEAILSSPEFLSASDYGNKIKSPLEFTVSAVRATGSTIIPQQPPPLDKITPAIEGAAALGRANAAERMAKRPRQSLNYHILELGEPLFACTPPTGYKEVSSAWVSPGALIERLNFAMALTGQKLSDVHFDPSTILSGIDVDKPDAVLNQCIAVLLQNNVSANTRKVLTQSALPTSDNQTVNPSKLIALIIGSPEFQRK
jgi:uncharacterized protein (DUF1800 family)